MLLGLRLLDHLLVLQLRLLSHLLLKELRLLLENSNGLLCIALGNLLNLDEPALRRAEWSRLDNQLSRVLNFDRDLSSSNLGIA